MGRRKYSDETRPRLRISFLAQLLAASFLQPALAAGEEWSVLSVRAGADEGSLRETFTQIDVKASRLVRALTTSGSGWRIGIHAEATAGVLTAARTSAFVATAGPGLHVTTPGRIAWIWLGSSPTVVTVRRFGETDLGSHFHFSSYAGLGVSVGPHVIATYRFQHTSNVDLWPVNPGLDMHVLGLGWRF